VNINLNVRARNGPPARLAKSIASAIASINPLAVRFRPLSEQIDDSLARERVVASLAGFFGILALLVAGLGLYAVTAFSVSRRRMEIGIRMALGASSRAVVRLVLLRVSMLVGAGILAGMTVSVWASGLVPSMLYGVEPRNPAVFVTAALTLTAVATVAGFLPAWRAARTDPMIVLRAE